MGDFYAFSGGSDPIEHELITVVREYPAQWTKYRQVIDSAELANLRWVEGWSIDQLRRHYQVRRSKIVALLDALEVNESNVRRA